MALKNYTTKVSAGRSIEEIQKALVQNGARGLMFEYDNQGRIKALKFLLEIKGNNVGFALPADWRKFQQVLKNDGVKKYTDEDYCYRVAWRCIRDWVLAQLALYQTQMVEMPQVFLPFAMSRDGNTLYEQIEQGGFLLGSGN